MSVPPELIQQLMSRIGGGAAGGAPNAGAPPSAMPGAPPGGGPSPTAPGAQPSAAPAAGPMSQPQEKKGLKAAAQTNVHIAVNMLEEALPAFGSESPEGAKILKALNIISSLVGKRDSSDLVPAEVMQMVQRLPQMGGGTNIQRQIMQMMQKQGQKPLQAPGSPTLQ